MRILPISSGKGGVGKTTVALNLALTLGRTQRTVLIDLDAGTSSLRNFLDVPVGNDLFHFLKKESPLESCRQSLPPALDPEGAFANFSFIASPRGFVHDIVNLAPVDREKLIQGINALQADYVILDLKAGLDTQVLDFLPISNSGIILFTPGVRAATMAAAEMAKAILFRMLSIMLAAPHVREKYFPAGGAQAEPLFENLRNFLQSRPDHEGKNLDDFIGEAEARFPQENFIRVLRYIVENYRIYYVLNRFNSIAESVETTITPFVENIFHTVSSRVQFHNLGWLVEDDGIRAASETGVPYLLRRHYQKRRVVAPSRADDDYLRARFGLAAKKQPAERKQALDSEIKDQIDLLRMIYICNAGNDPQTNLDFIAARIRELSANSNHQFGMKHIYSEQEFLERFQARL